MMRPADASQASATIALAIPAFRCYYARRSLKTEELMKTCKKCKAHKSIDEFGNDSRNKDGKKARCRQCLANDAKARDSERDYKKERRARIPTSAVNPALQSKPHLFYRLWDDNGLLLYVGVTSDLWNRFKVHQSCTPWWNDVASLSCEFFPDRTKALDAEALAIRSEDPLHNKQGAVGIEA